MAIELLRFSDRDAWRDALVERVRSGVADGVASRGEVSIAISGGSTPAPVYHRLNRLGLPWGRLHVTLADERWVPPEHAASNQRLVMETLFAGVPESQRKFCPLWREGRSANDAASIVARDLQQLPQPFELVLLGLGNDGHTASLFPNQDETIRGMRDDCLCVSNRAPVDPHERISLGLGALGNAQEILITITGAEKLEVFERARQPGPAIDLPVRAVLRQSRAPVTVYWSP